jgi:hypothetical protein
MDQLIRTIIITTFLWTKIPGPTTINIINTNAVETQITNVAQGTSPVALKLADKLCHFLKLHL